MTNMMDNLLKELGLEYNQPFYVRDIYSYCNRDSEEIYRKIAQTCKFKFEQNSGLEFADIEDTNYLINSFSQEDSEYEDEYSSSNIENINSIIGLIFYQIVLGKLWIDSKALEKDIRYTKKDIDDRLKIRVLELNDKDNFYIIKQKDDKIYYLSVLIDNIVEPIVVKYDKTDKSEIKKNTDKKIILTLSTKLKIDSDTLSMISREVFNGNLGLTKLYNCSNRKHILI